VTLPTNYTNQTVLTDTHPNAHNDVNMAVNALTTVQAWQTPTPTAPWTNYNPASFNGVGYFKDPFGIVHIRGMVVPNGATVGSPIFVLPVGYRPPQQEIQAGSASNVYADVRVQPSGTVTVDSPTGFSWLSLDGITFRVAPPAAGLLPAPGPPDAETKPA
jgi:hypothetical protein